MSNSGFSPADHRTSAASAYPVRYIRLAMAILLLASVTILSDGCAASHCDCPKFGGHHLSH